MAARRPTAREHGAGLGAPTALAAAGLAIPVAILVAVSGMHHDEAYDFHFAVVSATMAPATGGAVALTVGGARRRDARAVAVGAAFAAMAALLLVHGLGRRTSSSPTRARA